MRRHRLLLLGAAMCCAPLVAALAASAGWRAFPHREHERLFPVCEGCHAGIVSGEPDDIYPDAGSCARCHDGTRAKRVAWLPGARRASNLRFSHDVHRDAASRAGDTMSCQTCHATSAGASRMDIAGARPALCISCHAHAAPEHLAADAPCRDCHVPLAAAVGLDTARIARLPRPGWHDVPEFLSRHGADARSSSASCGVCHARESCERCHANAARLPEVTALERDARVAALASMERAEYPTPATHRQADWPAAHGAAAALDASRCANCHTQPNCAGCHLRSDSRAGGVLASLPGPGGGARHGVSPARMDRTVHPPDVRLRHGRWAATGALDCAQCHETRQCASCHLAQESRAFHPPNFTERHAVDAFAGGGDCQSCHRTETFCRDCHTRVGVAAQGRMAAAFHTAEPMWVLSHGQAARLGLETCVSCHAQNDCVRCHSAAGGWGVSPHGSGFAAGRRGARNAATCRLCHLRDPAGGE